MNKNVVKAVECCRVSSKEQKESGYSLDSQEKLLTDYAAKNGFRVEKTYRISESASGKQIRKTFNEMLQFCTKNKVNIILCEKIDRLTRNMKDAVTIDDWIKQSPERSVHFIKENFILNQNTKAHENLVWDMKVAIARFYTNNLSEEVRKGQKEKLAQGWSPQGEPPLGYKIVGEKGHKIHVIDKERALLVKKMFELYSTGNYSLSLLTKLIKEEGLRTKKNQPLSRTRIHKLLASPFYYGAIPWRGSIYKGNQEPLISKELFDVVQEKLSKKFGGKPMYKKHLPVFKAKIKCRECGGTITWECQKGHWYGHCNHFKNCSQEKWVKQIDIEEQLFPLFINVAPKNNLVLKWLEDALKENHIDEINYNTNKREELNKVIRLAEQRMEGAYRDKLDGVMPATLCEKIIRESTLEKEGAIDALGRLTKSREAYYLAAYSIHELALHAKEIYQSEKATPEDKRMLLTHAFSNMDLNEGEIRANYTYAFEFMAKWMPQLNSTFEPTKNSHFSRETTEMAAQKFAKRGQGDLNPRSPP